VDFKQREYFVYSPYSSLFNLNGLYAITALIKTEGLITPLATADLEITRNTY